MTFGEMQDLLHRHGLDQADLDELRKALNAAAWGIGPGARATMMAVRMLLEKGTMEAQADALAIVTTVLR